MSSYNALGLQVPLEHYTAAISEAFPKVFSPRLVETTIASRQTVDILPVNSGVNNKFSDTYLEFIIKGVNGQLVDLSSIALELTIDLTEEDGTTPIDTAKNVTIVNGISQTLFKSAIVYFNETVVESSSLFSHWSYIKLLSTISGCKAARYDKLSHFFNRVDPSEIKPEYFTSVKPEQKKMINDTKTNGVNTCFKLMLDATSISEYVLDNVDIRVRLELQPDKWVVLSDNDQANFKYNINSARLWIDRVIPYPEGLVAINKAMIQNNSPITYTFNKTLYKTYILGTGQRSITLDQPWGTVIPERLYMVILDMEAVSGAYNRNPLHLENCGLSKVLISQNSTNIINIACDFPHNCSKLYYTALQALGFDNDNVLSYDTYVNGGTILAFNLQAEDIDDTIALEKSGNLRIGLEFKQGVSRNKVIVLYGSTTGVISINAERRVVCDTRGQNNNMNCLEINEAVNSALGEKVDYLGCFLANDVRKILKKIRRSPVAFIMNTLDSASTNKMGHWIAFYVHNSVKDRTKIVILDSYANPRIESYSRYIEEFMSYFHDYEIYILKNRIQSLYTYYCGNYAVYFIFHLSHFNFEAALRNFDNTFKSGHYSENDAKVLRFTYAQMKMPSCKQTFCLNKLENCEKLCEEISD